MQSSPCAGRVKREDWKPPSGLKRTLTVALDTAQYQMDMNHLQVRLLEPSKSAPCAPAPKVVVDVALTTMHGYVCCHRY